MGAHASLAQNRGPAHTVGLLGPPAVCAALRGHLLARGHQVVLEHDARHTSGSELTSVTPPFAEPDVLVIAAPVTLTPARGADTTAVARAADAVAGGLRHGQLVVLTGPVPPGTTRGVLLPRLAAPGLVAGRDFFLAYTSTVGADGSGCVVGGFDPGSADAGRALLAGSGAVAQVSSLEAAEVSGALAPVDRWLKAALARELRVACARMGLDAWEIVRAAGAPALGPALEGLEPGPALLAWGARRWGAAFPLLERAADVDASTAEYVVHKVADVLNEVGQAVRGSRVAVVGVPHPSGRATQVLTLLELLLSKGSRACFSDPHIRVLALRHELHREPLSSERLTAALLAEQDCVVVAADGVCDPSFLVEHSRRVLDTCGATNPITRGREKIVRA